jgi:hypothetical protein
MFYVNIRLFPRNRRGSFSSFLINFSQEDKNDVYTLKKIISNKYEDYKNDIKVSRITTFLNDDEKIVLGETLNIF